MVTDAVMMAELEGITPASGYDGGKNLMNPQPMEVEESPVAGKDVISIPDAKELRRMTTCPVVWLSQCPRRDDQKCQFSRIRTLRVHGC